jgi:hypothetical protein
MHPVRKVSHAARGTDYELHVYQVQETSEYRIYVVKGDFGVGDIFTASQDVVHDAKVTAGLDIVDALVSAAIDGINRNEFGLY